jgi:hypothetical protein
LWRERPFFDPSNLYPRAALFLRAIVYPLDFSLSLIFFSDYIFTMKPSKLLTLALISSVGVAAVAQSYEANVLSVLKTYEPGKTGYGRLAVSKVAINDALKTIDVNCSETVTYLPLTDESMASLKNDIKKSLGDKYADYSVNIYAMSKDKQVNIDKLVLFADKELVKPTETNRFVTDVNAEHPSKGLEGKNIAVWQSHGWYFEPKLNRWEWQRARIFQTVEDLYTQSFVMPYLMPMLRNAGAYVMSPRERDTNTTELIVDNDKALAVGSYSETAKHNAWKNTSLPGFAHKEAQIKDMYNPFRAGTARQINAVTNAADADKATWTAEFPAAGEYAVYVSYQSLPNSATDALYTVNSKAGARQFKINQKMGGGTWIYLGHFQFDKGQPAKPVVELSNLSADGGSVISADAVKIGGGMGNVARIVKEPLDSIDYKYVQSGYPRFVEGARYWLQWAGAPDSVYTLSHNVNDYTDDYRSRGEWVNWLAGGSSVLPQREGLNIPVDLSFAWHSDAGTTKNDSIIGTLGIYCTDGRGYGDKYANGMSRLASRDLTNLVMTNIVDDVRATFEPNWTRRGMWDKSYYEARVPEVPAMLLEFLSHQNFADMKYGLDPEFRFVVSRAVYKGMLQFLSHRDGSEYVVQPLPINSFAINNTTKGEYKLTWKPTEDKLEATAVPTYYNIEERVDDGAFVQIAKVADPSYTVNVTDEKIHSYRVIAANDGGVSFPSEVLALRYKADDTAPVTIVNGFTRVSAPDWFEAGNIAGFYDQRDHGVPYINDISFIGSMFEYRRDIPWMDDDAAGFGASRANYEDKVVAGNTFDFVYVHGKAIADNGHGFVSSSVEAYMNAPVSASDPKNVDLILGKQKEIKQGRGVYGTRFKAFPTALQNKITAHTANGGNIFVSGAYVATDIWDNPNSSEEVAKADKKFATDVLGYHWRVGQASVTGQAYQVDNRFKQFTGGDYDFSNELNIDCYAVESPDSFYPSDSKRGCTIMRYTENNLVAGTAFDNGYRAVVIGFPFETIKSDAQRAGLMNQVLTFLNSASQKATTSKASKKNKKNKK